MESSGDADLRTVFGDYCAGQGTMDGKSFAKMCKDTKLLDKKLTATDVDLIFAKSKAKTDRRITFDQWITALGHCAEKKGVDISAVKATVGQSKGPVLKGTKAEANKFHDDKSLYTGVHAKGGPDLGSGTGAISDISQTLDRSEADVRGVKKAGGVAAVTKQVAGVVIEEEKKAPAKKAGAAKAPKQEAVATGGAGSLKEVFAQFSAGAKEIDGKTFAKFAKDCGVISKKCSNTDIDLIFAKVKDKTARKIDFAQFDAAVEQCAAKRGETKE